MPRAATGTVVWVPAGPGEEQGHYKARITLEDGSRPWVHFDPGQKSPTAEAKARDKAVAATKRARKMGAVAVGKGKVATEAVSGSSETVAEYAVRWIAERKARGLTSVREDEARLTMHVLPVLGGFLIVDVSHDDIRRLVQVLDDAVRGGKYRWKTAINIFGVVTRLFSDASASKRLDLRVRSDSPAMGVRGPDRGGERGGSYLYPVEALRLLACEKVPLLRRVVYAVAMWTGMRWGELQVLRPESVQLKGGYILVSRALNRLTKEAKGTKNRRTRKVPIAPSLMPLMVGLVARPQGEGGLLLDLPMQKTHAERLRADLLKAGVVRAELYANDEQSMPINFHSLRHTYATWLALDGHEAMVIQQRGGWADLSMVQRYVEEAEVVGGGDVGVPFPELPGVLMAGLAGGDETVESSRESSWGGGGKPGGACFEGGIERGGRDLNPRPPA